MVLSYSRVGTVWYNRVLNIYSKRLLDMAQSCKLSQRDLRNLPAAAKCKDVLCIPGYDLVWDTQKHPVCWGGDPGNALQAEQSWWLWCAKAKLNVFSHTYLCTLGMEHPKQDLSHFLYNVMVHECMWMCSGEGRAVQCPSAKATLLTDRWHRAGKWQHVAR